MVAARNLKFYRSLIGKETPDLFFLKINVIHPHAAYLKDRWGNNFYYLNDMRADHPYIWKDDFVLMEGKISDISSISLGGEFVWLDEAEILSYDRR